jgi:hypothetical protein
MRLVLAALLIAGACRDQAPAPPPGPAIPAPDPWSQPAPTPPAKPPDTPETRRARADTALARVAKIKPEVARLRGLAFTHDVPTHYQPTAEFQAFVHREIAKELPPARSRAVSAALAHLGMLTHPVDLAQVEEQAMITQAGAYYDPAAKAFFLVVAPDSDTLLDTISAHELTHALQDQHFDLTAFLPPATLDDDAATARRFVAEGDATLTMMLYMLRGAGGATPAPAILRGVKAQIAVMASQDLDALKAQAKAQVALLGGNDPELTRSLVAMDDIPPAVLVPLFDAYTKGAQLALVAYERGGWPAVDALYRDPPTSTEQVLHPETKLFPTREAPHQVTLARTADPILADNVLGELAWRVYFALWKVAQPADAAAGWGGDRYAVTRRADGRLIGRIATTWDSADAAARFTAAYVASLTARFPGVDTSHPEAGVARPGGGKLFLRQAGARVFIVDGADDATALDALVRTARFDGR